MTQPIGPGGTFPELTFTTSSGGSVSLPKDIDTPYAVVLFYRGHW